MVCQFTTDNVRVRGNAGSSLKCVLQLGRRAKASVCAQADMVLSSIGYRSEAIEGVAFDARRGVVMHRYLGICAAYVLMLQFYSRHPVIAF